ncbi:hypothetical protein [Methylomonas koyamae]|uniref:hypothetical protein n=1 Tax=Methylomonas koyamae TaxID=702114 RepID=UPI0006D25457|nr:hypothetical protein [Methylomonas koyamae]BBL60077.1 hypothetical protein MKFW12EY_36900 [Methylomonas koyamae]
MNDWLNDDEVDSFTLNDDIESAVIRKALKMPPQPPIDWPSVLSLSLWSVSETICNIFGIDSELYEKGLLDSPRQKFADAMRTRLEREAMAENLPHKIVGGEIFYKPNSAIAWAVQKGFPVIPELKDYISNVIKNRTGVDWGVDILPLETLTDEDNRVYNNLAAWSWVDAIYILQGYKPVFQLKTEQVRSHFSGLVNYFTQSIQLGVIGKEITQAGEKSFIDSPANWQAFWQGISKQSENVASNDGSAIKPRKKLIPKERETTESLLLIYEITKKHKVNYRDDLPGPKAWGKIVSGEFTSDLIKVVSDTKKSITLNDGEKLYKTSFLDKYRKRFK